MLFGSQLEGLLSGVQEQRHYSMRIHNHVDLAHDQIPSHSANVHVWRWTLCLDYMHFVSNGHGYGRTTKIDLVPVFVDVEFAGWETEADAVQLTIQLERLVVIVEAKRQRFIVVY